MAARFTELIVDARDPESLSEFWKAVLGWHPTGAYADGVVEVASRDRSGPSLVFVPVPEPKAAKNRLHLDLNPVGCTQEEELERLLALGATRIDVGQGERSWVVLADPEGNEFCLLATPVDH